MTNYEKRVRHRSIARFVVGLLARAKSWTFIALRIWRLRRGGASIGASVAIGKGMRFADLSNLTIGNHCSLQSGFIDTRSPVVIGKNVIIGSDVSIITCSHDVDSPEWEYQQFGLQIGDYVWIASGAKILPGCRHIGRGAVIGAYSVVVKDVPPMAVMGGNPARVLRQRVSVHANIVPEACQAGDLCAYWRAWFTKGE